MNAIKAARRIVLADPTAPESLLLSRLAIALGNGPPFNVCELYGLKKKTFEIAIEMIAQWRFDRSHGGKLKMFDLSVQTHEMARADPDLE